MCGGGNVNRSDERENWKFVQSLNLAGSKLEDQRVKVVKDLNEDRDVSIWNWIYGKMCSGNK